MLGRGLGFGLISAAMFAAAAVTGGCTPRPSAEEAIVATAPPVYCYRTLGIPDCYREPLGPFDVNRTIHY